MNDSNVLSFQLLFVDLIEDQSDDQGEKPCVPTAQGPDQPTLPFPGMG